MKILLLGSGKAYIDTRCYPTSIKSIFQDLMTSRDNQIIHLDIDESVKPDIVADVTKNNWWTQCEGPYDVIIDTISHIGPHTTRTKYHNIFKEGIKHLLVPSSGIFYGHLETESKWW